MFFVSEMYLKITKGTLSTVLRKYLNSVDLVGVLWKTSTKLLFLFLIFLSCYIIRSKSSMMLNFVQDDKWTETFTFLSIFFDTANQF